MNIRTIILIRDELLNESISQPILTINKLTRLFINQEAVNFIKRLITGIKCDDDVELLLIKVKKLLLQVPRSPDPYQLEIDKAEFAQYFKDIKSDQKAYNPVRWVDAELEFIKQSKLNKVIPEGKLWLSREEVMQMFGFSITTLNRRIANNMPCKKLGGKVIFNRQELNAWLSNLAE